jgi:RHS repeat-associated protein
MCVWLGEGRPGLASQHSWDARAHRPRNAVRMGCEPMKQASLKDRAVGLTTLLCFVATTISPSLAWAVDERGSAPSARVADEVEASDLSAGEAAIEVPAERTETPASERPDDRALQGAVAEHVAKTPAADAEVQSSDQQTLALPTGADKSGVTSQAISTPKGEGTIQGMGESFSAQLSTGIATFSVPFALPAGRGGAQPSLGLSYSSASGAGLAGMGWSVGLPFIARQTDRGLPKYEDCATWHAEQDRFVFNGGQELVPICTVTAEKACTGALPDEVMPPWSAGHQYFRPRVEGSFLRFFWSPDHLTWRVQDKSGVTMELGVPLDGSRNRDGLEVNPTPRPRSERGCATTDDEIYRWHLVRQYDTYGDSNPSGWNPAPFNVVVYKYFQDGGQAYLSDIYDTTPATDPTSTVLGNYAHHTHLEYEARSDPTESYRTGWLVKQTLRLGRVDVTSKTFADISSPRRLVRRYHLEYDTLFHTSYLASVQVEGRCTGDEASAEEEVNGQLGATSCDKLPPMTFEYSHVTGYNVAGTRATSGLDGYEAFDKRVLQITGDPPHSVDEELADYFDINSDGLPDMLVTAPGVYGNDYGVFFNSAGGTRQSFGEVEQVGVRGVLGANSGSIKLSNANVAPLDLNADGTIDFLHMPKVKTYSVYTPQLVGNKWTLVGSAIDAASKQNPKINLGQDAAETRVVDVNFDGMVDLVVSTGTEFQTFLSLGRLPGGDAQFGHGRSTGGASARLSNDPIAQCVPYSGTPVRFSDGDVQLADINGDGIQDLVRLRRGDFRYWPGRGNGYWGTGKLDDCPAGMFGDKRSVAMDAAPYFSDIQGTSLRMDDVNGDGLDDLVQVRFDAVDVWLNVDGKGWTQRHIIDGTPASPSYANRVRLIDINGSGTRDIVWGNGKKYQFIDLAGGERPGLLVGVKNGLGKSTAVEYVSSSEEMLAAERTGSACGTGTDRWVTAWCSKMPSVTHVVKRVTESDNLSIAGGGFGIYATEYHYRDPVFEGRQREFRGFRHARSKRFGDANSPTDFTESSFLLGECEDETPSDGVDDCSLRERWRDNPKEALKGLPIVTERYDERGVYLSTEATSYRLRRLYDGLDGRRVSHAFVSGKRTTLYDTAGGGWIAPNVVGARCEPSNSDPTCLTLVTTDDAPATVELEDKVCGGVGTQVIDLPSAPHSSYVVPLRASTGYATTTSQSFVDAFGNGLVGVAHGCVAGTACPIAEAGISADETICSFTRPTAPFALTGWMYRTDLAWSQGSVDNIVRGLTGTTFTAEGAAIKVTAGLTHTLQLERATSYSGRQPAPDPVEASEDGDITLSVREYDDFGNVKRERGATYRGGSVRCRAVLYDGDLEASGYAQFPVQETIYVNGCTVDEEEWSPDEGPTLITKADHYDRGVGLATLLSDMTGQQTRVTYDGFGRLVALVRPRPDGSTNASTLPSIRVSYDLPSLGSGRAYSIMRTEAQDGASVDSTEVMLSYNYVDGMGRPRVGLAEADPDADGAPFVVSSVAEFDAKGAVRRKYLPFYTQFDPEASLALPTDETPPATPYSRQRYDAFGRQLQTFDVDGTITLQTRYHALSTDLWDAADLYPGPYQGSYASSRTDGHGRTVATTERVHVDGALESREVRTKYLASGQPQVITRVRIGTNESVVRWMGYDSLGRMVINVDPHTTATASYTSTPTHVPGLMTWHYVYNDASDLVGTSDARGCGQNFVYDGAGRLKAEDYSPCLKEQASAVVNPDLITGAGYEVFYEYDDDVSVAVTAPAEVDESAPTYKGRLRAVHDRAATTWFKYDSRGRAVSMYRKVSYIGAPQATVAGRYVNHWYQKNFFYDAADRSVEETTGVAADSELRSSSGDSSVSTTYTKRGTLKNVTSSYGELVKGIKRTADGLVTEMTLGDAAATRTAMRYDARRRLASVQTFRSVANLWSMPPPAITPEPNNDGPTRQLLLQDLDYSYDVVNNPIEIRDWRTAEEWPEGAKPVTRRMEYDDLNRVTRVDYEYPGGYDTFTSPYAPEVASEVPDSRRATPPGHKLLSKRPLWHTYKFDWLGNTTHSDDDQHAFYDRSMGTISNGAGGSGGSVGKPYQMVAASQPTAANNGSIVNVGYDETGNVTSYRVARSATACTTSLTVCSQRYFYDWDEVGRLQFARRVEGEGPNATGPRLDFLYDANDERVVKRHYYNTLSGNTPDVNTLYVFDSLEIRRAEFNTTTLQHPVTSDTEVAYLTANGMRVARLHLEPEAKGEPRLVTDPEDHDARLHVFLNVPDHLGSSSLIVDKATSELVEARTYQPYGATESDYRPERWKGFREDYGFTGKEEDIEVGLQYFGKRYLSPYLGRWLSPDPLAVHSPGSANLNLYAYVSGAVLKVADPTGLCGPNESCLDPRVEADAAHGEAPEAPKGGGTCGVTIGCAEGDAPFSVPGPAAPPGVDPFTGHRHTPPKKAPTFKEIQMTVDLVGASPTPAAPLADIVSVGMSLSQGEWGDAAIGVVAIVPAGDLLKLGKYADEIGDASTHLDEALEVTDTGFTAVTPPLRVLGENGGGAGTKFGPSGDSLDDLLLAGREGDVAAMGREKLLGMRRGDQTLFAQVSTTGETVLSSNAKAPLTVDQLKLAERYGWGSVSKMKGEHAEIAGLLRGGGSAPTAGGVISTPMCDQCVRDVSAIVSTGGDRSFKLSDSGVYVLFPPN